MHRRAPRLIPRLVAACLLAGLGLGVACKDSGGGSNTPESVEGSADCPRSRPRNGASCPRGATDFCVYRSGKGDHVCACGKGNWRCAAK